MKTWERSKQIIAFFHSYPKTVFHHISFYTTVISNNLTVYQRYHSSYDNPEFKEDPYQILEELVQLLRVIPSEEITINLMSTLNYKDYKEDQSIYQIYVIPMIEVLAKYKQIVHIQELPIDIFTLKGLYNEQTRTIIPDVLNTVIYI